MTNAGFVVGLDQLAASIPDGASMIIPPDHRGPPTAAARALIRRGVRDLNLIGGPTLGFAADLLVGAGCVASIETAGVGVSELGAPPRFRAAVESGAITMRDSTCPAIHAGLQAAEKGVPFMPLRGLIGSDIQKHRGDWRLIDNPFSNEPTDEPSDPIVLLPAIVPDIALFHAALGDRHGNVWVGMAREHLTMAHAAKRTLVTVEQVVDGNLLDDRQLAPGCVSALYVERIAEAPKGCWPAGFGDLYPIDIDHLRDYFKTARSEEGFRAYLDQELVAA